MILSKSLEVKEGLKLSCLYPKHGKRNINTSQNGEIVGFGDGIKAKFGPYVTIRRSDGSYRTLSLIKMVRPTVG